MNDGAMLENNPVRRPIKARETAWAGVIARRLGKAGLRPNLISMLSVVFAGLAALGLTFVQPVTSELRTAIWLGAAACIQLRLLCNLFDGMVAIEGGLQTKSGEIFNELPDRLSDALILVGVGYAAGAAGGLAQLGWAAALLAVITAHVRTLGAQAAAAQQFCGPMAKQQRMFLVTAACLMSAILTAPLVSARILSVVLWLIVIGCVLTSIRRTWRILNELESGSPISHQAGAADTHHSN